MASIDSFAFDEAGPSSRPYTTTDRSRRSGSESGKEDVKKSKKRRVTQSCNVCRRKRIKCDGKDPICGPCSAKGLECGWAAPKRRGPLPGREVQAKIHRFESHLWDLYQVIPGLRAVSELLLGIASFEAGRESPMLLHANIPRTSAELETLQNQENNLALFRETPVGKLLSDDPAQEREESGEGVFVAPPDQIPSIYGDVNTAHRSKRLKTDSNLEDANFQAILSLLSASQPSADVTGISAVTGVEGSFGNIDQDQLLHAESGVPSHSSLISSTYDSSHTSAGRSVKLRTFQPFYRSGQIQAYQQFYGPTSGFANANRPSSPARTTATAKKLPSQRPHPALCHRLVDLYLTIVHPSIPMCSRHCLLQWSSHPPSSNDAGSMPALLLAVLACAAPYLGTSDSMQSCTRYLEDATELVAHQIHSPSLETVQALLLLAIAAWGQGDMSVAWVNLARSVALAVDLGLHLKEASSGAEDQATIARQTTWYSIVYIDVLLSSQLGRCPLSPSSYTAPPPPVSGSDEWELWRSESVNSLREQYGAESLPQRELLPTSFGFITPARTLSTFEQTIALSRIAHVLLSVINRPERKADDGRIIAKAIDELNAFREVLSDMEATDASLSSVPRHRLDLCLLWYQMKLIVHREIPNSDGRLRTLVEEAGAYLGCKIRLFSYYRSPVFSSLLLFTLSTFRDRRQASDVQLESIAFQELSCIFPRLVEWLPLSPSSANSHVESHGTYVSHSLPTPATSSASSLPLHSPVSGSAYNQPSSMNIPHSSPQHPAAAPHWSAAHATPGSALALSMTNTVSDLQQTVPQEAHRTPNDAYLPQGMNNYGNQNGYSLPFQAMESLSKLFEQQGEADRLDTSRLFDSATWEQTDVLSSLGYIHTPRPSNAPSPNEFSGLTGMLNTWNHGDGGF